MTTVRGIFRSVGIPVLLLAGVAFSASGCIIDGSSSPPPDADGDGIPDGIDACPTVPEDFNGVADNDGCPETACSPDLYVNWRIVESGTNAVLTCDQVPATNLHISISGQATDVPCPAGISQGQVPFFLDVTGTYTVMVTLLNGNTVLSQMQPASINVDCSGQTQTPLIDMVVN
jgi:hypothetical protein